MSANENRGKLRRYIEEVNPGADVEAVAELVHEDVVLPADSPPQGRQGLEGLREHMLDTPKHVRYRATVEETIADGDDVLARVTLRGTVVGDLMGVPADGKEFEIQEYLHATFRDGKISEIKRIADMLALVQQVGGTVRGGDVSQPRSGT